MGVIGRVNMINEKEFSTQPIASLDWNTEKIGLGVISCLD
jgi:hypothetical protein